MSDEPPLVSFQVTNPVTYLKLWWKKIMRNEGVDFRFRIRPVTAVLLASILVAGGAGFGWVTKSVLSQVPVLKDFLPTPIPIADPWRDTAYSGTLRKVSEGKYYLQTGDGQAVTLSIPENVNLEKFVGKRIFASGKYNRATEVLLVEDATDLEVVIQSTGVPTEAPKTTDEVEPYL